MIKGTKEEGIFRYKKPAFVRSKEVDGEKLYRVELRTKTEIYYIWLDEEEFNSDFEKVVGDINK